MSGITNFIRHQVQSDLQLSRGLATLTLRDLRLARFDKKIRNAPCGAELDAYLSALARFDGNDEKIPASIQDALAECMGQSRASLKPASIKFHVAKFVDRDRKN